MFDVLYFAQRMRQALFRFGTSLKRRFLLPRDQMESRLGMIGAVFGTSFLSWLLPKIVWAQTGNAAVDAPAVGQKISSFGTAVSNSPIMGPMADAASYMFNIVATLAASFLYLIIYALIFVNTLITDLMIRVAQYNNFVNAKPVQMGWPLVRDVCNMFFIVVLLLIAFSTIIGYKPFHFKDNLPKLLLYAVLINFSRTLIGLLIDFSQVVMLTFVVGFKDAAFGNFAKAFQVPNLLSLNVQAVSGGGGGLATTSNIIVALLFGIWIMTIAMTALVIMLIYFIARIISLWVLLILSPLAFFALGVPSKISSAMGGTVGSFWKQLSAWLTGGPIVAFFLWLALAVIQSSDSPFADVGGVGKNTQEEAAVQAVITDIGKPENVLNFIVSVAFMLIGVKTAVDVSGQANPMLGNLAKGLSSGGGVAWKGTKALYRAPGAARSAAGAVAQRGVKLASYIPGSKGVAGKLNEIAGQDGRAGSFLRGTGIGGAAAGVLQERGLREEDRKKASAKRIDEQTKGLSEKDAANRLAAIQRSETPSTAFGRLMDKGRERMGIQNFDAGIASSKVALLAVSKNGAKAIGKEFEDSPRKGKLSKDEVDAVKASQVKQRQGLILDQAEAVAKAGDDSATLDAIKAERHKDPGLMRYDKMAADMGEIDPKGIKPEAWGDNAVFIAYMQSKKLIGADGKLNTGYQDSADWKNISSGSGNGAKLVRAQAKRLESAKGQDDARVLMAAMSDKAGVEDIKNANDRRSVSKMSANGEMLSTADWIQPEKMSFMAKQENYADVMGESRRVGNFDDLVSRLPAETRKMVAETMGGDDKARNTRASRFSAPLSESRARELISAGPALQEAAEAKKTDLINIGPIYRAQAAGITTSEMGLIDVNGNVDPAGERVVREIIDKAFMDANANDPDDSWGNQNRHITAAQAFANIDNSALRQGGTAAKAIVGHINLHFGVEGLNGEQGFKQAISAASPDQMKQIKAHIQEVVRAANAARSKSTDARSAYENEAITFQQHLSQSEDKVIRGLVGNEKGTGKKKR